MFDSDAAGLNDGLGVDFHDFLVDAHEGLVKNLYVMASFYTCIGNECIYRAKLFPGNLKDFLYILHLANVSLHKNGAAVRAFQLGFKGFPLCLSPTTKDNFGSLFSVRLDNARSDSRGSTYILI